MHGGIAAVTIKSNKTVSNEVKDKLSASRPILWKNQVTFLANPIFGSSFLIPNNPQTYQL